MDLMADLTQIEEHFAFGENWASYADTITERQIEEAVAGLQRLLLSKDLARKRLLDIGCGSGIHSLAALRLGAGEVLALDLDPDSVKTTKAVLARYADGRNYRVEQRSVFDLSAESLARFDVVYSWGVLHHTGNMDLALRKAAALVQPGGLFIFALYRKTMMCPLWKMEKRWYAKASKGQQSVARHVYIRAYRAGVAMKQLLDPRWRPDQAYRGMDFHHDVHDWLGGHPYESILPEEVDHLMRVLGFELKVSYLKKVRTGILGSGCDEYCYLRSSC